MNLFKVSPGSKITALTPKLKSVLQTCLSVIDDPRRYVAAVKEQLDAVPHVTILDIKNRWVRTIELSHIDYRNLTWGMVFNKLTLGQLQSLMALKGGVEVFLIDRGDRYDLYLPNILTEDPEDSVSVIQFPINREEAWKILFAQFLSIDPPGQGLILPTGDYVKL